MFGFIEYSWMSNIYFGNSLGAYLESLVIFVSLFILFELFQKIILIRLQTVFSKTKSNLDDVLLKTIGSVSPFFYWILSFYFASNYLELTSNLSFVIHVIVIVALVMQSVLIVTQFIDLMTRRKMDSKNASNLSVLRVFAKISVWVMGALFLLSNLGIDVTSLVAGLGIGGIAVALAVQNVLEDLFSSFVIYFDKPFKVGDFVSVGKYEGTVEKIGIKTTRLRALVGEEIVISNKELTSSIIQNYRLLKTRRVEFEVGVTYETSKAMLDKTPKIIEEAISKVEGVEFTWANVGRFADSAIVFVVVYNVLSNDYIDYMNANHSIHCGVLDAFNRAKIEIAYPTRVVYTKEA
jgi:small-conductance mechanosensitive channel